MTDANQLLEVCKNIPSFLGVFAADELPDRVPPGASFIVNYDEHDMDGTHWCAARFPQNGPAEWFDSYGLPPDREDIILRRRTSFRQYLARHGGNWGFTWNKFDFQALRANTCGEWAALFVHIGGLPDDPSVRKKWVPFMRPNVHERDRLVREVVGIRR